MRKTLAFVLAVGMIAPAAMADMSAIGTFHSSRDTGIIAAGGEEDSNSGGASWVRAAKWSQHSMLVDFDMGAVQTFLNANPLEPGYTVQAELILTSPSWGGFSGETINVRTCDSTIDWVEGDGPFNMVQYNWSAGVAATSVSPVQDLSGTAADQWGSNNSDLYTHITCWWWFKRHLS